MSGNPASAALAADAGNAGADGTGGTPTPTPTPAPTLTPAAGGDTPWFGDEHKDVVAAKGWKSPNDVLESYRGLEKVLGTQGSDPDRVLLRPKSDAPPEEIAAFREKAGFSAPKDLAEYGFTEEQINAMPVLGEAAKWAQESGLPADVFKPFAERAAAYETAKVEEWNQNSQREWDTLRGELGDKFDDAAENARRFARANKLDEATMQKIEFALGTKSMFELFSNAGKSLVEATPPNPGRSGGGQFQMTPEVAKSKIAALQGDTEFMAKYMSPNPAVRMPAIAQMEELHKLATGTA